jgi:hypothetical protein
MFHGQRLLPHANLSRRDIGQIQFFPRNWIDMPTAFAAKAPDGRTMLPRLQEIAWAIALARL